MQKIRPVQEQDAGQVHALACEMGYKISKGKIAKNIRLINKHPEHTAFVAEKNGNIPGWIHVFIALRLGSNPFAEIGGLAAKADTRRLGVGGKLVQCCEKWAFDKSIRSVRVRCHNIRKIAHEFYHSLAFNNLKPQCVFTKYL